MKLYIDTSNNKKTIVRVGDKQITKTHAIPRSQILLELIDQLLKQEKKTLKNISEISVNPGPGSFTSLRVGISVANALRFALNLGQSLHPHYGSPPHITTHKEKSV